ncbi:DUF748 domain-containing protein [Parahaliea maris]|uniref:DUF748 domain-containing protein n=1 Tax=Parahaliea maris TaxID=2716870 RepID=A0A5C8ZS70_9GAMM|nr:DUF748 domain-containing protein [Parahaliea maris]TXS90201.1 DUF748 domain-containing protein [Parahaliea maris]
MKKLLRALALIYLGYLLLSALVILPLLNFLPPWFVHQQYQRDLDLELVVFNPFSLSLSSGQLRLSEAPTTPVTDSPTGIEFASLDNAEINLSLTSLWRPGWVFDTLAVEGVSLHLRRLADEGLNIDDFLAPGEAPAERPAGELPGVTVNQIRLSAHRIMVSDEARTTPYRTHWDELRVRMSDLSTVLEAGHPYHLRVFDESGGSLEWEGELSIPRGHSAGRVELSVIGLRPFWRFVKDQVDFEVVSGRLGAVAKYELNWSEGLHFTVDDGGVDISRLALAPVDPAALPDTGIDLAALSITGIHVAGDEQQVSIDSIAADGLNLSGWLEGEQVSLADMFRTRFASGDPEPAAAAAEPASPWRVNIASSAINEAEIAWRSPFTEPQQLTVSPFDLRVTDIRWPVEGPSQIELDFLVNDTMTGRLDGQLQLESGDGAFDFATGKIPLAWFAPNIPDILNAQIDSGQARSRGNLSLTGFAPQQIRLEGAVDNLAVHLYGAEDAITRWKSLAWKGLNVDLPQRSVDLARLHLDGYAGRVHIHEDGTLNIQRLLQEDAENKAQAAQAAGVEEQEPAAEPWRFAAPDIAISDSEVDFMDESLPIHFRTIIGDVNGAITGLNSDPDSSLSVDITGSVDGYAPVVLAGSASPFHQPPAVDLDLTFQGVDLARLTPYSGTYAGYAIDRGTLNLDLKYSLANDHLEGDNKVVIQQLKLGKKIDSDKALDIPLQLGIALLTDASGVIDLAVPVSGDVDNPEFSLGSVIMGAFVNLLTKAITAPFTLLANLVGSEDDLQRFNFAAGSSELDEYGRAKMTELAEAMAQRPKLKLVIGGRLNPASDRQKLQQQLLREALLAEGLTEQDIDDRNEAWEAAVARRYAELPAAPEAAADNTEAPSPLVQARRVQAQIAVPDDALKALAEERAASSKRFLVNEAGVAADRAVIEQTDPAADYNSFSGVEMSVDT